MSLKTIIRLRRETSKSYTNPQDFPSALAGYLMKVFVEVAHNIDSNVFVMQRDVQSNFAAEQVDTFYSIASVGEIEWIPVGAPSQASSNFFRTNQVELMFETIKDLEEAWEKISKEVLLLARANDSSINTSPDLIAIEPPDAFPRYYGAIASPFTAEQLVEGLIKDNIYSPTLTPTTVDVVGTRKIVFAIPESVGEAKILINGSEVDTTEDSVFLEHYGLSTEYRVYETEDPAPSGSLVVATQKI